MQQIYSRTNNVNMTFNSIKQVLDCPTPGPSLPLKHAQDGEEIEVGEILRA